MEFLGSRSRKLVFFLLALFSLCWVLFLVGFALYVNATKSYYVTFNYIPGIISAIAGPIIVVLGFLHAITSGPISAILGSLTAFTGVLCCIGFGHKMYATSAAIYFNYIWKPHSNFVIFIDTNSWLQVAGCFFASLAWMCVMIAWNCFSYDKKDNQVESIVDEAGNLTSKPISPSRPKRNVVFAGIARKLAIVMLILLGASWCLYIVGVANETRAVNATIPSNGRLSVGGLSVQLPLSTWTTCVVGLFSILSAVGHTGAYGGASTAMGVFTAILGMFFIASVGYVGLGLAIEVHTLCPSLKCSAELPKHIIYQLSGALGMCVWWACLSALWPFYFKETKHVCNSRRNTRLHHQYSSYDVQDGEDISLL